MSVIACYNYGYLTGNGLLLVRYLNGLIIHRGLIQAWANLEKFSANPENCLPYKIRAILVSFQMVGLPGFRSRFKSRPLLEHPESREVRIADPHSKPHFSNIDFWGRFALVLFLLL